MFKSSSALARPVVAFICAGMILSGCATRSDSISAQYVSEVQYRSYDCDDVAMEMSRVSSRVAELAGKQDKAATTDAVATGVGLVLFWPALFVLAGTDDHKEELGRLKGEYEALQRVAMHKDCDLPTPVLEEQSEESTESEESDPTATF